jgi:hypothetical protein
MSPAAMFHKVDPLAMPCASPGSGVANPVAGSAGTASG